MLYEILVPQAVHKKIKSFKCDICNYSCSYRSSLKTHVLAVHHKLRPYKCNDCEYVASTKGILKKHAIIYHTSAEEKLLLKPNPEVQLTEVFLEEQHVKTEPVECEEDQGSYILGV